MDNLDASVPGAKDIYDDYFVQRFLKIADLNKPKLLKDLFFALKNQLWMALDLNSCTNITAANVTRGRLIDLLIYFYQKSVKVRDEAQKLKGHDTACTELGVVLNCLQWAFRALGVDLATADSRIKEDPKDPKNLLIPNAQPLELLVTCILEDGAANLNNLGALKARMATTQITRRQRQAGASQLKIAEIGMPAVVFVCWTDKIVACSADYWGTRQGWKNLNDGLQLHRKARLLPNRDELGEKVDAVSARWEAVEKALNDNDNKFITRAKDRKLSNAEYNDVVNLMYDSDPRFPALDNNAVADRLQADYGYCHQKEIGYSFFGRGVDMFDETSRCWKCRFLFHYDIPRPQVQGNMTGLEPEDPKKTAWNCNPAFTCAEDVAHVLCWAKNKGATVVEGQAVKLAPFPHG